MGRIIKWVGVAVLSHKAGDEEQPNRYATAAAAPTPHNAPSQCGCPGKIQSTTA